MHDNLAASLQTSTGQGSRITPTTSELTLAKEPMKTKIMRFIWAKLLLVVALYVASCR